MQVFPNPRGRCTRGHFHSSKNQPFTFVFFFLPTPQGSGSSVGPCVKTSQSSRKGRICKVVFPLDKWETPGFVVGDILVSSCIPQESTINIRGLHDSPTMATCWHVGSFPLMILPPFNSFGWTNQRTIQRPRWRRIKPIRIFSVAAVAPKLNFRNLHSTNCRIDVSFTYFVENHVIGVWWLSSSHLFQPSLLVQISPDAIVCDADPSQVSLGLLATVASILVLWTHHLGQGSRVNEKIMLWKNGPTNPSHILVWVFFLFHFSLFWNFLPRSCSHNLLTTQLKEAQIKCFVNWRCLELDCEVADLTRKPPGEP